MCADIHLHHLLRNDLITIPMQFRFATARKKKLQIDCVLEISRNCNMQSIHLCAFGWLSSLGGLVPLQRKHCAKCVVCPSVWFVRLSVCLSFHRHLVHSTAHNNRQWPKLMSWCCLPTSGIPCYLCLTLPSGCTHKLFRQE